MTELRHRRGTSPKERIMDESEEKALLAAGDEQSIKGSDSKSTFDGYVLVPLQERWILSRLDVGPFIICYLFLISLDFFDHSEEQQQLVNLLLHFAFPLILLAHITLFLLQQWDVFWRATVGFKKLSTVSTKTLWTHCLVEAPHVDKHHSAHDAEIVEVTQDLDVVVCKFQDIVFRFASEDTDLDVTLWSSAAESKNSNHQQRNQSFHRLRYPVHLPLSFYQKWGGHVSQSSLLKAQRLYGSNTTTMRLPPFLEMLQEQLVAPFFLFQMLCVVLWCLDEYWYYAIFTGFALLMFESTVAFNRLKGLQRLRSHTLNNHEKIVSVFRPSYPLGQSGWTKVSAAEIVPGDIICCKEITTKRGREINQREKQKLNRVPADILILSGDVVVDESLLTGESVPQLKTALEDVSDSRFLDLQEHKQSICFGGTNLLVTHPGDAITRGSDEVPTPPDQGVVGIVLRTGFETAQGSLLRTMAHTQKSVDGIHTSDTYVFILLLLLCAFVSAYLVWKEGWADPSRNRFRLILHLVMIVTSVVPPELPMELSLAVTNSVADLMKRCRVFCTEIFRIPIAGQVDVCCFDKTGTLTSDEMQLKAVRLVDTNAEFGDLLESDSSMPWPPTFIMASCHSLALSGNGSSSVIGDPLETAVLKNTGYKLLHSHLLQKVEPYPGHPDNVFILRRFGFTSRLKRMTVLAKEDSSETIWALTKGAPEVIKTLLKKESCPIDYDAVSMRHMASGQRVLAMAYRKIAEEEIDASLKNLKRDDVERDLIFVGFLLLDCPVKGDSKSVVQELQNSGHQVTMITGDSVWTAAEVARQVGIIGKTKSSFPTCYQLKQESNDGVRSSDVDPIEKFCFVPMAAGLSEEKCIDQLSISVSNLRKLKEMIEDRQATLCITGEALQKLVLSVVSTDNSDSSFSPLLYKEDKHALFHPAAQAFLKDLVPLVSVFARHSPQQKEAIIAAFNLGGHMTLMAGDGTNDTLSLRRAHVGISIISAPEVEAKQRSATAKLSKEKAQQKKDRKKSKKGARTNANASSLEESLRHLREAQDELEQVDLGDASIASPFTSRSVSIKCCKDVLQQGRCTLVTMLQIYKILGINCLVNAMVLSNLFLHGVKQGDRQLTVTGLAIAALFLFVARGKPLKTISPIRPPSSVLCASALLSIALQVSIHLWAIRLTSQVALSFVDPYDPSMIPDGPFNPNTLNTSTFLMNVLATVNSFAVNYRGEPFVEPLKQNKMLLRSLQICYVVLICCSLELFPPLSDLLQLSEFPSTATNETTEWETPSSADTDLLLPIANGIVTSFGFPVFMFGLMVCDTALTFASEKLILRIFEPMPS